MSLPLALDLTDRLVVMVGGGPVTGRRLHTFVAEGSRVRVVAPWVCEDVADVLASDPAVVEWVRRDYTGTDDLDGAWLGAPPARPGLIETLKRLWGQAAGARSTWRRWRPRRK